MRRLLLNINIRYNLGRGGWRRRPYKHDADLIIRVHYKNQFDYVPGTRLLGKKEEEEEPPLLMIPL